MGGATRGGTAEPMSRDRNTRQERGQGKGDERKSHKEEETLDPQTEAARQTKKQCLLRQSGTRNRAHVRRREITVASHNVHRRWRWMGCMELDGH